MDVRDFIQRVAQLGFAAVLIVAGSRFAFAQSGGFSEENIPPSAPISRSVAPSYAPPAARPAARASAPSPHAVAAPAVNPAPRPRNTIPYTVRPGDTLGTVATMFGVTPDALARANRMSADDELYSGDVLKVPNPFTHEVSALKTQVEQLNAEAQTAEQKATAAQNELSTLRDKVQELSGNNQELNHAVAILPWWRATAFSVAVAAVLMFGVMLVTLFEWWRMRRRYVALAETADALGRLDYKYKAMLAKAELRLQQLYGRRRQGLAEGQPRAKLPEELEIERLNEELKELLEYHLVKLGARPRGQKRRGRWREMFGGVDSPVEARSVRR
jgi:LysM repeat protein